jgi:multidrug resistance efflux pump
LRETGTLAPRDPVVVPCPFDGRLQWIIDDATWVEAGQTVVIISDDDERRRIAEDRAQLAEAQQDLALSKLRRAQAEATEAAKVTAAARTLELERIRHRVLTTPAKGGLALVEAARELEPLLAAVGTARRGAASAQAAWQATEDAWLQAIDRQQDAQDEVDRLESLTQDLAETVADASQGAPAVADAGNERSKERRRRRAMEKAEEQAPEKTAEPAKSTRPVDPQAALAQAQRNLAAARGHVAQAMAAVVQAQAARAATAAPKAAADRALAAAEDAAREPQIRLEIERRVLPATELAFDAEVATATLAGAERRLADGKIAHSVGVVSTAELADLQAARDNAEAALAVVRSRLEQAARPPTPEAIAEAEARLAKAQAGADAAEGVRQRNLGLADAQIAVAQAKVDRFEASLAARTRRFPSTITQELATLERERLVRPEDARLDAAIAQAKIDLAAAIAAPPNVIAAPVTGLVRVRREGSRQKLAGDQIWQSDPVVEVHPPANLEVLVRVNEANIDRVRADQPVTVTVPALPGITRTGRVLTVSGAGRDKGDQPGGVQRWTGVTQFDVRVTLDPGSGDADLRQGMTALVAIATATKPQALALPRSAARRTVDGWAVIQRPGGPLVPIQAEPFGDDMLLVPQLAEGATVYIQRVGHE